VYSFLPDKQINIKRTIILQQDQNQIQDNEKSDNVRLRNILESLIATQGGYFSDKLYSFTLKDKYNVSICGEESKANPRWLVLGREHYFETVKEYPIANKRDLLQALEYDDDKAPFEGVTLHYIERINEQSHRVTFWVIHPEVFNFLPVRPWLIIPESFVFSKAIDKNTTLGALSFNKKTVFIAKTGKGFSSGIKTPQTATIDSFAFATGAPSGNNEKIYVTTNNHDFESLLYQGLKSLTYNQVKGLFVKAKKIQWHNYPWQSAASISLVVFCGYLTLTSAWLAVKQYRLDNQLEEQVTKVNKALALQNEYRQQMAWQEKLSEPLKDKVPYWHVWHIVLDTISTGAEISAVHFKNNKILVEGDTNQSVRATDVLAKISNNSYVASPSFSKPVRKRRNKEEFSISLNITEQPFDEKNIKTIEDSNLAPEKHTALKGGNNASK
jgi:hypothetical protein